MSETFRCDDKDTLVAYLYDEIEPAARRQVEAHLRTCAACAREVEELHAVRHELSTWQPPEVHLDFAIVQKPATVLRPARWAAASLPAWARVAAAILVVAAGAAIANLQVRYNSDGFTMTTGWMSPRTAAANVASIVTPTATRASDNDWRPALTALEADLRREMQSLRASAAAARTSAAPTAMRVANARESVDAALVRRVQSLVSESEQRQRQELAIRLAQFNRDLELQRRADLVRIDKGFGQLQGQTGAVRESQREMMNLLRRVSTQVP